MGQFNVCVRAIGFDQDWILIKKKHIGLIWGKIFCRPQAVGVERKEHNRHIFMVETPMGQMSMDLNTKVLEPRLKPWPILVTS